VIQIVTENGLAAADRDRATCSTSSPTASRSSSARRVRHDLIDAVFALGGEDDLVRLLARVTALQAFVEAPEGANLLAGYKRAANILKKENWDLPRVMATGASRAMPQTGEEDPLARSLGRRWARTLPADAPEEERALVMALDEAEPRAAGVGPRTSAPPWRRWPVLRGPIDAFFDQVTVNDPAPEVRRRRLNLLARFRDAVHGVADFSRIEG
jgi:glycyl-tRNA synthetase beta chain